MATYQLPHAPGTGTAGSAAPSAPEIQTRWNTRGPHKQGNALTLLRFTSSLLLGAVTGAQMSRL